MNTQVSNRTVNPVPTADSDFSFLMHVPWMCTLAAVAIAFTVAIDQSSWLEGGAPMQEFQPWVSP